MNLNGIQSYRKTSVVTADPKRLVIMCYEGAIDHLKIYKIKNSEKNYEDKAKALSKACAFINELMNSLDFEKGGHIARNLDALYNYMTRTLIQGDIDRDTDKIDEVANMLCKLREAWEQVFYGNKKSLDDQAMRYLQNGSGTQAGRMTA